MLFIIKWLLFTHGIIIGIIIGITCAWHYWYAAKLSVNYAAPHILIQYPITIITMSIITIRTSISISKVLVSQIYWSLTLVQVDSFSYYTQSVTFIIVLLASPIYSYFLSSFHHFIIHIHRSYSIVSCSAWPSYSFLPLLTNSVTLSVILSFYQSVPFDINYSI